MGSINIPVWITGSNGKQGHSYTLIARLMCFTNWEHNISSASLLRVYTAAWKIVPHLTGHQAGVLNRSAVSEWYGI